MNNLLKLLDNNEVALLLIASLEAIIIIVLVVYNFSLKWELSRRGKSSSMAQQQQRPNSSARSLRDVNSQVHRQMHRQSNAPQAEREKPSNSSNTDSNNESEEKNVSKNNREDFVNKEKGERSRLQESTNDDGTTRSDIYFDATNESSEPVPTTPKVEYLEAANGGQFRKLLPSDEKSFFRSWEEKGVRKFEFHGNVDKTLANINAIFDDVCEIEGKQNGASNIINVEPGILDRNLKVEKKAKVKLI